MITLVALAWLTAAPECEPPPFPLSPGCVRGKCTDGVQRIDCKDGRQHSSCAVDGTLITTDICTIGCTARGWQHYACVHPKPEQTPSSVPTEAVPEYPKTWDAYGSRPAPPPGLDIYPFSLTIIQGRELDWKDELFITNAKAAADVLRMHVEKGAAVVSRGALDAAQVKRLMQSLSELRPWDMKDAYRKSAKPYEQQAQQDYKADLRVGKTEKHLRIENGCPSKGPCVQLELMHVIQQLTTKMKPEKLSATQVATFEPRPSKGPAVDGNCSPRPVRDDWFWCEVSDLKYDHCVSESDDRLSCARDPFGPVVNVHRVGEVAGQYLPAGPWAVLLESGEKCVRGPFPAAWQCGNSSRVTEVVPGEVWVALDRDARPLLVKTVFAP